jgi:hypothetical protein
MESFFSWKRGFHIPVPPSKKTRTFYLGVQESEKYGSYLLLGRTGSRPTGRGPPSPSTTRIGIQVRLLQFEAGSFIGVRSDPEHGPGLQDSLGHEGTHPTLPLLRRTSSATVKRYLPFYVRSCHLRLLLPTAYRRHTVGIDSRWLPRLPLPCLP